MKKFNGEEALRILEELRELGCIDRRYNPQGSDYYCRYCGREETESHAGLTINHHKDCIWLKIERAFGQFDCPL